MNKSHTYIAFFVFMLGIISCQHSMAQIKDDNVKSLQSGDPVIKRYQDTAQKELPYLIKFIAEHAKDDTLYRYAVKVNFTEGDNSEHMWVQVNDFKSEYFIGRLANEPGKIKFIKYGDYVKVKKEEVEDWILEDFLTNTKLEAFLRNICLKNNANITYRSYLFETINFP